MEPTILLVTFGYFEHLIILPAFCIMTNSGISSLCEHLLVEIIHDQHCQALSNFAAFPVRKWSIIQSYLAPWKQQSLYFDHTGNELKLGFVIFSFICYFEMNGTYFAHATAAETKVKGTERCQH